MYKSATIEFKEWLEKKNTKQAKKVLAFLDRDIVIVWKVDNFYQLEKNCSFCSIPDYVYNEYLKFVLDKLQKIC